MEIGVQNGGSLELWDAYFGEGARIAGVDVDPACAGLDYPPHIQVFIGDQTHSPTLHGGHHTSSHQHTPWSSLGAIHIYDSIAFIQKAEREMPRAWRMPPVPSM